MDALQTAKFQPQHPKFEQIQQIMTVAVQKALTGEVTPQAALDEATAEDQRALVPRTPRLPEPPLLRVPGSRHPHVLRRYADQRPARRRVDASDTSISCAGGSPVRARPASLFIAPTLILVGVIVLYPILEIVLMSFSSVNSIAQRDRVHRA